MEELFAAEGTGPGGRELPFDESRDLVIREPGGESRRHRLAEPLPAGVLHAEPADGVGRFADDETAVRQSLHDAFAFEVGVGPTRDVRIDEKLLGEGSRIGQRRPRRDRPRCDVATHLVGDLLVNRNRRIVLNVEHVIPDGIGARRPVQWADSKPGAIVGTAVAALHVDPDRPQNKCMAAKVCSREGSRGTSGGLAGCTDAHPASYHRHIRRGKLGKPHR